MRLPKAVRQYGLIALGVPGILLLTGISTLADASPSPSPSASASGSALPGDPTNGQAIYGQNCATCHGTSLEGGIGPQLNPIAKLPGVSNPLDTTYLINTVSNGIPGTAMPAWKGPGKLSDQQIKDVVSFIIQQNATGTSPPLSPNELAKRTMLWVGIGILGMVFITYLLSQYNMRWIARRAAARRR